MGTYTVAIRIPELEIDVFANQIVYVTSTAKDYTDFPKGEHEFIFKPDRIGYYNVFLLDGTFLSVNNDLLPREKLIAQIANSKAYKP